MYTTTNRTERKRSLHRLALVAVTFTILVPSSLANAQVYEPGSSVDDKGIGEWLSSYANWIESEPPVPGTNRDLHRLASGRVVHRVVYYRSNQVLAG